MIDVFLRMNMPSIEFCCEITFSFLCNGNESKRTIKYMHGKMEGNDNISFLRLCFSFSYSTNKMARDTKEETLVTELNYFLIVSNKMYSHVHNISHVIPKHVLLFSLQLD